MVVPDDDAVRVLSLALVGCVIPGSLRRIEAVTNVDLCSWSSPSPLLLSSFYFFFVGCVVEEGVAVGDGGLFLPLVEAVGVKSLCFGFLP